MNALTVASTSLTVYNARAYQYAAQSKSDNTIRAYKASWREFESFAVQHGESSLPASPSLIIDYLTALADHGAKVSTIQVKLAAIASAHRTAKQPDPTNDEDVRMVMGGIRRALRIAPSKKAPVTLEELRPMLNALPDTLAGKRDRAILLVGFAGAFRRSELIGVDVADIRLGDKLTITIKRSKTDQEGKGLVKVIPSLKDKTICPVEALRQWLNASEIKSGAIFRQIDQWGHMRDERLTPQSVALIVKSCAIRAGLEPRQFAGHSLRSGFITEAAGAGVDSRDIMAQTGHRSEAVMRGYIQDAGRGASRAVKAAMGEGSK